MSVFLIRVMWYPISARNTASYGDNQYQDPIEITDLIDMSSNKALEIKNNLLVFKVKNSMSSYDGSNYNYRYINDDGTIKFSEQDQIKVYAKYTDDGADIESSAWQKNSDTLPSDDDRLGNFYVIEIKHTHTAEKQFLEIRCADKTYILFNRVYAQSFTESDGLTAPEIIQKIVRYATQVQDGLFLGTGDDAGARFDVDGRLVSETTGGIGDSSTGHITDTRRAVTETGTVNADTSFPEVTIAKVWKPIYEWINDLSQVEYLNKDDELAGNSPLVYGRPFVFFVDDNNEFNWFYPDDTISDTIIIGQDSVFSMTMTNKVFDAVNMVIFNAGEDMYGTGLTWFVYNPTSNISSLKTRYQPLTHIAEDLYVDDLEINTNRETTTSKRGTKNFPTNGSYPISNWSFKAASNRFRAQNGDSPRTTLADDDEYNDSFREAMQWNGQIVASSLVQGLGKSRYKGSLEVKGSKYTPGQLLKITNRSGGIKEQLLRIQTVRHLFRSNGWFTTLEVEEDQEALSEALRTGVN